MVASRSCFRPGNALTKPRNGFDALANKPQDKTVYEQTELHYRQWAGPDADAPNVVLVQAAARMRIGMISSRRF